jgi:hypothetical protein
MRLFYKALIAAAFLFGSTHSVQAVTITYSTGDFVASEWSSHIADASTGTSTAFTSVTGGNLSAYRRVSMTVTPFEAVANHQLWQLAKFTPATQGVVTSAALSYDISRVFSNHPAAIQVAKGISMQQDGIIHTHLLGVSTVNVPTWESVASGNLVSLFPGNNWQDGNEITFGFFNSVGTQHQGFTIDGGYDNYTVTVDYAPNITTQVPEPLGAFVTAIVVLLIGMRSCLS